MKLTPWIPLLFFLQWTVSFAADSDLDQLRARLKPPVAGAHQGGLWAYIPNTLPNFKYAQRKGVDIIEMDLRISADGIPVIFHDESLQGWTDCRGLVRNKTVAELKRCRFPNAPDDPSAVIPTFEEVLAWANTLPTKVVLDPEFKELDTIAPALELVKKYNAYSWIYFQAEDDRAKYELARKLDPRIGLLFAVHDRESLNWALALNDEHLIMIEVDRSSRTPENLAAIHAAGKLVTEDSWHFDVFWEIFGARCTEAYQAGIDIPISNSVVGCIRQRDEWRKAQGAI